MKREVFINLIKTYHLAVVLADLYFTKVANVQKSDLQLVGAASMYIASKI
jgi:hypothetical protein